MHRKLMALVLALAMCLSLAGCGAGGSGETETTAADEEIRTDITEVGKGADEDE